VRQCNSGRALFDTEKEGGVMAARLTDMQKKQIIADYVELGSYNAVAKKHRVSATTVKKLVIADAQSVRKCEHKKEQNTLDMLAYMDSRKASAQEFIDLALESIKDPRKLDKAGLQSIATALGIIVDKFIQTAPERDSDTMKKAREILGDVKSAID
jgi:hypothetical protein